MNKIRVASTWLGIFASIGIVFGTMAHAAKTDPVSRQSTPYTATHGVVIPPLNG